MPKQNKLIEDAITTEDLWRIMLKRVPPIIVFQLLELQDPTVGVRISLLGQFVLLGTKEIRAGIQHAFILKGTAKE